MSDPAPTRSERRDARIEARRVRRLRRPPWSWQGATAFMLALTVVVSMTALITGVIIYVQDAPLPENIGALITATLSALIGAVAGFLGRVGSNEPHEERSADQPQAEPQPTTDAATAESTAAPPGSPAPPARPPGSTPLPQTKDEADG